MNERMNECKKVQMNKATAKTSANIHSFDVSSSDVSPFACLTPLWP